jgi:nucleoside-diphosphate-sugar epimerase
MSTKGLVLVTGANGYIAARTVEAFLQAGYSVRGTVRSLDSANTILKALSDYVSKGHLEMVQVADITAPGAFDAAVIGTTAIAHLATPVSGTNTDVDEVMNTAINGTLSIAESALQEPSVKSLVLMSSIAAVRTITKVATFTEKDWNGEAEALVEEKGADAGGFAIYSASKVASERALWQWVEKKKPHFSVTALNPV